MLKISVKQFYWDFKHEYYTTDGQQSIIAENT
jgi:hypothetical protein